MLEVRLIGKFEIKLGRKLITISSRAAQSLFAYLIINAGTSFRREKLAGMFWPDVPEEKARAYLRHELWRIRKALPSSEFLLSDNLGVAFDRSTGYWLDVQQLLNLNESASVKDLSTALSLYQGELLPGFYEEWVIEARECLQAVFEKNIARLLTLLEKEKRWHDILQWGESWISFEPATEAAFRYLMIAYDALEDHTKVASTYERCMQALRQIDLEPSEETRALAFKRSSKLNIPISLTSFIGRETEIKEVSALLSKSRLVTLTGSGGVGKTRLAIQITAEILDMFPDGVWFLDLAPLNDPALVPNTLVGLLGLRESGELSVTDLLINCFRSRTALIVFDNCEHLIDSCARLINLLLTSCERLWVLATSRESLRISGESSYRVPSLEIPKPDIVFTMDELSKMESVRLFVERAALASSSFAMNQKNAVAIGQICTRLDGIPLAIELAAARTNVFPVYQILQALDDRLDILTHGLRSALPRHQTLQTTIDWSYNLLSEDEQLLLQRLSVFAGGWTLEAAEQVCQDEKLQTVQILDKLLRLVDKSLVMVEQNEVNARYHTLETIRQYAQKKLNESGASAVMRTRHLEYFCSLAEQAHPHLKTSQQFLWLDRLEYEHDNIRFALKWAQQGGDVITGLRLATELKLYWMFREYFREATAFLEALLGLPLPADQIQLLAKSHRKAGWMQYFAGNRALSLAHVQESERLLLQLEVIDKIGLADTRTLLSELMLYVEHDPIQLGQMLEENLKVYQAIGNQHDMARTLGRLSTLLHQTGDLEGARQACEQSVALFSACGDNIRATQESTALAILAIEEGRYADAREQMERAALFYSQAPVNFAASVPLWLLGAIAIREREYERAKTFYTECVLFGQRTGELGQYKECFVGFAGIASAQDQLERAALLLGAAEARENTFYLEIFDRLEFERLVSELREKLGDKVFDTLAANGRVMTLDQAVAFALEKPRNKPHSGTVIFSSPVSKA